MTRTTSGAAFAAANAAMVKGVDGASTVHVLLTDCVGLLGADAAGVLVTVDHGLELLAATSHSAIELELHQAHVTEGPCVEVIESGTHIAATNDEGQLVDRWPDFGRAMSTAGFQTVLASPMLWHERVFGGLNLFWSASHDLSQDQLELAQGFADIATLALMQAPVTDEPEVVAHKLRTALQSRVVIERAKGVLAQTDDLEMDAAFARLIDVSERTGRPLAHVAQGILDDIAAPQGPVS